MDTSTPASPADDIVDVAIAVARDRVATALEDLSDAWTVTAVPGVLTASRSWPDGSTDTVVVLSPDVTHARRDDPAASMVIRETDSVEAVVKAVCGWPDPTSPDAPRTAMLDRPQELL